MYKLMGYIPMKKKTGKVLFALETVDENRRGTLVGQSVDKIFVFDEMADGIDEKSVGRNFTVSYTRGSNGMAYVAGIDFK